MVFLLGFDGRCWWWSGSVGAGAVGVAVERDDVRVVDEAVDGRGSDDIVAEGLAPPRERQIRGQNDRSGLIA